MTTVVHYRDVRQRIKAGDSDVVYIGRPAPRAGLAGSKWANPYTVEQFGREGAIDRYRTYMGLLVGAAQPAKYDLSELRGKTLACWCKPLACHGDVLAEWADQLPESQG